MKHHLIFLWVGFAFNSFGQTDTIYFDKDWNNSDKSKAEYIRVIKKSGGNMIASDFDSKGNLQSVAAISSIQPFVKEGKCTIYDDKGRKESEGDYKNDKRNGIWTWWIDEGKDSMIIEYDENGFKNRIRPPMETVKAKDGVFTIVEQMPVFPGGEQAMLDFISNNVKYPKSAREDDVEGRVIVQFVISKTGDVVDAKIVKSVRSDIDEAALNVVNQMPQWNPGIQDGKTVLVSFNLPINFTLTKRKKKGENR